MRAPDYIWLAVFFGISLGAVLTGLLVEILKWLGV